MKSVPFVVFLACLAIIGCNRTPQEKAARFLRDGRELMARKDYTRAALQFRNAVQLLPKDAQAEYEMGLAYLAGGDPNAGVAAVFRATQLDPKLDAARIKLAELMAQSGNAKLEKEGEKRMRELLAANPGNTDALNALALAEIQLGESEDAENHLQEALRALPKNLSSTVELARVYLTRRDTKRAEEVLKQAVEAAPKSAEAAVALGSFYMLTGRWAEAETELQKALAVAPAATPKDAGIMLALAAVELRLGKKDQAKEIYRSLSESPDEHYKHVYAAYLFTDGEREAGIKEFEKLVKSAPHDRAARNRLVAAYMLTGREPDAEKVLAAALKENSNDIESRLQRSQLLLRSGKDKDAEADLNEVLHFKPDSAEAHYLLAQIHGLRGEGSRQTEELSATLRYNPAFQAARISLAQLLTLSHSPAAALEVLNAAPEGQKQAPAAMLERNLANYAAGDHKAFRDGVAQAMQLRRTPDVLLQDAVVKLTDRDYAGARASSAEALRLRPDSLRALEATVFSYAAQNQTAQAERFLTDYGAQSKSAAVQEYVGEWLWSAGKHDQARASWARAKAINPRFLPTDLALAEADLAEGNLDRARTELVQVLEMDSRNFAGRILLARVETRASRYPEAVDQYRKALELQPGNFLALNNLAYLLADKAGQPDEALPLAQRALELAPENPDGGGTLGWVFYHKGLYQEAERYLRDAVKRDGGSRQTNAVIRKYHLAMAYVKLGDRTKGLELLVRARQQNPGLPEAEMVRVILGDAARPF